MKTATVTQAKNRLSALLAEVKAGETVVIMDRGIPVARIDGVTPLGDNADDGRLARLQRAGALAVARAEPAFAIVLGKPPRPEQGASAVDALIDERHGGR